jgi:hypothetical protein
LNVKALPDIFLFVHIWGTALFLRTCTLRVDPSWVILLRSWSLAKLSQLLIAKTAIELFLHCLLMVKHWRENWIFQLALWLKVL